MRFWGITGTNGKTTSVWIFAEFLNAMPGRRCGSITTVEVNTGSRRFYTGYTTPPLKQLREIYAEMEANGCTDCVMEVSSHAIHQRRTGETVFAGGAFTNLSEDHLDYHKTMEEYFRVKRSFADWMRETYVVCLDGGYGREMYDACKTLPIDVIPVTREKPAFDLTGLRLVGAYNESNVLVAAALAEAAGVSHDVIQSVIPTLVPRWGRLERVENPSVAAEVYVDFAHTPDGLEKVLTAVRGMMEKRSIGKRLAERRETRDANRQPPTNNQQPPTTNQQPPATNHQPPTNNHQPTTNNQQPLLWVVFGAGGDRDPMKRPLMGEVCARLADRLVVTSDNPRSEAPLAIIDQIVGGIPLSLCLSAHPAIPPAVRLEPDRAKAIAFALENAVSGDVVVIAGKGHETTQEIKGVKHPFDDREIVRRHRT